MENQNIENLQEAAVYFVKATSILNTLHANLKVYGSNSGFLGGSPADIDLGLQYINRSLSISPNNSSYLNMKALLLWEGKGEKAKATELLEKAAKISPRDIDIQNNLIAIKKPLKLSFVGYLGITIGLLLLLVSCSEIKDDISLNFKVALSGIGFILVSFYAGRR